MKYFKQLIMSGMLFAVATNAFAIVITSPSISGTMKMSGSFYAINASNEQVSDARNATGIDFDFFGLNKFRINSADDDFTGLETVNGDISTLGDITDFQFTTMSPIADFWVVGDFSFELTDVFRTNPDSSSFIDLVGTGVISAAGFQDTESTWMFSGDTSGGGVFSWSADSENAVATVPEPGVLALLSIGLIGLGLRKKFEKKGNLL